jgi:dihydroxyacetone kinase-like protein
VTGGALTPAEARAMLVQVARRLEASEDELNDADRATGDGDHGLAMARGFGAVGRELESGEVDAVDELVRTVGRTLLTSMGGASGVVFSTLFTRGAARLAPGELGSEGFACLLADGLAAVEERGGARPGDKTMVDALAPAAGKADELRTAPLATSLPAVATAAREGAEQTKAMVARAGKAKTLGERSLGHPDPGALSVYLMLRFMAEYVSAQSTTREAARARRG